MNILFVIPSLMRAGAERVVVNTCNELIKDDRNKVAIFLIDKKNEYSAELDERIIVEGGGISFHLSVYKKNRIENKSYVDFASSFKPDVIHSHLYLSDILAHSHHFKNAKYISHIHNSKIENYNGFEANRIASKLMWTNLYEYKWLIKRHKSFGTNFVACSAGAQKLHEEKIRVGKVIALPNAIRLPEFAEPSELRETVQLIWIGRLNDVKRPHLAISIAHALKEKGIRFHLKIAGIGPEMEDCISLIQELSLTEEVEMMGLVDNLHPIYSKANLMIHTSRFEGLPMVFIEAAGHGIPIITTDCLPENDIIENGVNGQIISSDDVSDFVLVITSIVNDSDKHFELSKNALTKSKQFGIEEYAQKLMQFYASN